MRGTGNLEQARDAGNVRFCVLVGWVVTGAALFVYLLTLAPTFTWGDSADLALRTFDRGDRLYDLTPRGYAMYRVIGRLFLLAPCGDVAYRVNLMTAFFGALTVGCIYAVVALRTRRIAAGVAAACALGLSHTFWLLAVVAEVYTLATLLGGLLLLFALAWQTTRREVFFQLAALAAGLSLSHHLSALLYAPGCTLFLWLERRHVKPWMLLRAAGLFLLGAMPLAIQLGQVLSAAGPAGIRNLVVGPGRAPFGLIVHDAVYALPYLAYQFPGPAFVLGVAGIGVLVNQRRAWDLAALTTFLMVTLWAIGSHIPDKYNSYVLSYPIFAIVVGTGVAPVVTLLAQGSRRAERSVEMALIATLVAFPLCTYSLAPRITKRIHLDIVKARPCPNRDNDWYFLYPPKRGYDGARRYAESALTTAEPAAVIVADYTLWRPLRFLQRVEGFRTDVELVPVDPLLPGHAIISYLARQVECRPTYLATDRPAAYYDLDLVRRTFVLEPVGPLLRVRKR